MTVTEKVAYLKGLAEGLALDENKPETKIINAMMDVLDELALTVSDLEDGMDLISEQLDAVDEDLDELEGFVYEELDGCDCDCDDCDCDDCYDDDVIHAFRYFMVRFTLSMPLIWRSLSMTACKLSTSLT